LPFCLLFIYINNVGMRNNVTFCWFGVERTITTKQQVMIPWESKVKMELNRKSLDEYEKANELIDEASSIIGQAEYLIIEAGDILEKLKLDKLKDSLDICSDSDDYQSLALKMGNKHSELECELELLEEDEEE